MFRPMHSRLPWHFGRAALLAVSCVIAMGWSTLYGCNLGFQPEPLGAVADTELDEGDTRLDEDVDTVGDLDTSADTAVSGDTGDTGADAGFSDQACAAVLAGLEQTWTCLGAPPCGISFLPLQRGGRSGAVAACVDGQALRWYPYLDGTWEDSFAFGTNLDRPLTGAFAAAGEYGVAVVRRSSSGFLEWEMLRGTAPEAPFDLREFGSASGRPFAGPATDPALANLWVFTATSGGIESMDPRTGGDFTGATFPSLMNKPFDGIFSVVRGDGVGMLVLYDLDAGEMTTAWMGSGTENVATLPAVTGNAVILANADSDADDEVLVCRPGELAVLELGDGVQTQTKSLGGAAGCLPGVERDADGGVHLLAFLPTAGVLLRSL